ncbi:MAG TPA: hypothetical protein VKA36_03860, partial [Solirubrobacterales bacterium]|nr:hypothetical protein [Solirubrobacterales bacterium]
QNLTSDMAAHASQLYSKNLENLLGLLTTEEGELSIDFSDEVIAGACITHEGAVRNERAADVAGLDAKPIEAPAPAEATGDEEGSDSDA